MVSMMNNVFPAMKLTQFVSTLQTAPITTAGINDYHLRYIQRMLPVLDYYVAIYARSLSWMLEQTNREIEQLTLVDYGGGEGFCSLLMKYLGVGQVIYVDMNSEAADTVDRLSDMLGWGPDVVLTGDARTLRKWCEHEGEVPNGVMGMDVIEHIYSLDEFFCDIISITHTIPMLFTTASTPYNHRKVRQLHKAMQLDEQGDNQREGFWNLRRSFIAKHYPLMEVEKLDYWATHTRGLNYDDILRAVDRNSPNLLRDRYNTCDPTTGSWTERILPVEDYRQLLLPYHYTLHEALGFYNTYRKGIKGGLSKIGNRMISTRGGKRWAPFLYLLAKPFNKDE